MAKAVIFLGSCAVLFGCAATRTYPGPERSRSEVARVYFYSKQGIESGDLRVDGSPQGLFDLGLEVLPGEHTADLSFKLRKVDCNSYFVSDLCITAVYSGTCHATLRAAAGQDYAIDLTSGGEQAFVTVRDAASDEISGSGSCATTDHSYESPQRPYGRKEGT